jgi:TonB-linked SusC/RagA family outer membrane protein
MRKFASLLPVLMLLCALAFGQTRTVTGQVKDEKGNAIPFATVTEVGSGKSVKADANGFFSIGVAENARLSFSAVGFTANTVTPSTAAGSQTFTLATSAGTVEEVVVTALGIRRKPEEIGYATARVTPEQITAGRSFNLAQALSGKVSGLTVSNTSAAVNATPRIVLRGLRSITGDNTALIVLDGVPVPSNTISYINPNDVERVDVLKGGQAATLFGSDGVNGAIVITTKKGSRRPEITLTHSSNVENLSFLPKTQHGYGSGSAYGDNKDENFHPSENQQYGPAYDGSMRPLGRVLQDGSYQLLPYSDIEDAREKIWNTGYTAQSDLSYRAGDENSNFYASYQNVHSEGIVPGDKYNRNSFRMNAGRAYGKFKLNFDATYTWDHADRTNSDFYFFSLNTPSWVALDQYKDWKNNKFAEPSAYFNDYYNNPWWQLDNNRWDTRNNYFNGNVSVNFKATNNLEFTYRLAMATTNTFQTTPSNVYTYTAWAKSNAWVNNYNRNYDTYLTGLGIYRARNTPIQGSLGDQYSYGNRINSDLFANYTKNFNNVSLKAIVGNNVQVRTSKGIATSISSIAIPGLYNVNNSQNGLLGGSDSRSELRKIGSYADVTVGLNDYLYVHGTFRYDWSSVFYSANRDKSLYSFPYYGADVSLVVTDLLPSIKSDILNYVKVRGGWNKNGNDNVGTYQLETIYTSASGFPYSGLLGTTVGNTVVNPNLKPEIVTTGEVGIEVSLWKSRISMEASYYNQLANNQILNVAISSATGSSNYLLNAAKVTNKGFEFDLKVNAFKNRDWNVNLTGNYSHNTNVVNELFAGVGITSLAYQQDNLFTLNAEVGQMFPYLKTTRWQRDPQGRVVIDTTTGWPIKANSTFGVGSTTPKNILGAGINVSYKNFTLIANAEFRGDFVVYHDIGTDMTFTGSSSMTTLYDRDQFVWPNSVYQDASGKYIQNTNIAVDYWDAIYFGLGDISNGNSFPNVGEIHYSSGDFWKIRDVSLSYEFPQSMIGRIRGIRGIALTAWARNLKTWLAPDNYYTDPEFSNTSGNSQGVNTTLNTPPTRQIGGTLRVTF